MLSLALALCTLSIYARAQAPAMKSAPAMSGRSAEELVKALRASRTRAETDALEAELLKHGAEAVKPLIEHMAAHKGQDRVMALIASLGTKAPAALVALLPDDKLRSDAARVLAHAAGTSSADQAGALLTCLSKYPDVKNSCGIALVRGMNSKQGRWIPRLAASLKGSDRDERLYAALALKQIGLTVPGVRAALMTVVSDPDDEVRGVVRKMGLKPAPKPAASAAMKAAAKPAAKGVKAK